MAGWLRAPGLLTGLRAPGLLTGRSLLLMLLVSIVAVAAAPAPTTAAPASDEEQSEYIMILDPQAVDVELLKQTCDQLTSMDSTVRLSAPWRDRSWRWYVLPVR